MRRLLFRDWERRERTGGDLFAVVRRFGLDCASALSVAEDRVPVRLCGGLGDISRDGSAM